jgi:LPLT family lysophospholipid transporter-like MFS transporter
VLANGWMEGLTVAAIILGAILGGVLVGMKFGGMTLTFPDGSKSVIRSAALFAVAIVLFFYLIAAIFNLYIPQVAIDHKLPRKTLAYVLHDFWHCFKLLWRDPLGQVSLAVTTLFWGVGATLRLIVITWAASALKFGLRRATFLTAVVAVGIALGSILAAKTVVLERAVRVLPMGIAMGLIVVTMTWVTDWRVAVLLLALAGTFAGYFVVPMNALLQHRGHLLMGAGHSIAVQNFNENLSILALLGIYALMIRADLSIDAIMIIFGAFISFTMLYLYRKHRHDQNHRER